MRSRHKPQRIAIFDALRGLCVIMMVLHHAMYNVLFGGFDFLHDSGVQRFVRLVSIHPVLPWLSAIFASIFIFLAGMSCKLSRNNPLRAGKIALGALAVTAVTWIFEGMPILFGILHFLAVATLIFILLDKLCPALFTKYWLAPVYFAIFLFFFHLTETIVWDLPLFTIFGTIIHNPLTIIGFRPPRFQSLDFFGLFPWIFMFFAGAVFGNYVKNEDVAVKLRPIKIPVLDFIGRHTLLIFLLHQPIMLGVMYVIQWVW
ncbi:MAG: DUF1624 domain-containing protein [Oscillospiraceae bacterium]|nr:DUF1624 domain-containing protein [Oscillospiraceae bacterium]